MLPFDYAKAKNENDAMDRVRAPKAAFVAGGTTLIDLMKLNVMLPAMLVDINGLPLDKIEVASRWRLADRRYGPQQRHGAPC